ncbi:MAG: hypothetical protein WCF03_05065 [Nitrososphaeraceae archaeon]
MMLSRSSTISQTHPLNGTKFDGKGFCFIVVGKKTRYIDTDCYNEDVHITKLEPLNIIPKIRRANHTSRI